ncbi:MAG TPA: beta/gamma crystallin family protein [Casimicrobiaceae bacterium]|nr:beta/gamma crystallin family protein [Casimicrobiaceae bacterium]
MHATLKCLFAATGLALAAQAGAQVTLYSDQGFHGRQFFVDHPVRDLDRTDFNDRASSAVVQGGDWQVCQDAHFQGRCVILHPGEYVSLDRMGMNDSISSIRPAGYAAPPQAYAPPPPTPPPGYAPPPAPEALYQAPVTSVHAVVGPPEQRCWVERDRVPGANVPGAIIGGIVGGVLGHQIGSGRGNDVATVGGAVAGAAVGANVGTHRDVQRCENVPSGVAPDYWDVTYEFRGVEHHAQLGSPPGQTITVNGNGEPRG